MNEDYIAYLRCRFKSAAVVAGAMGVMFDVKCWNELLARGGAAATAAAAVVLLAGAC
jgi:hypothetical protein